ncbi:MAG: hypothetical protein R3C28_00040, partial [Pirellulaceae bacterium]
MNMTPFVRFCIDACLALLIIISNGQFGQTDDGLRWMLKQASDSVEFHPKIGITLSKHENGPWVIRQAIPSKDRRYLLMVLSERESMTKLGRVSWCAIVLRFSTLTGMAFHSGLSEICIIDSYGESGFVVSTDGQDGKEEVWEVSSMQNSITKFQADQLPGSPRIPLATRLILHELRQASEDRSLAIKTIPTHACVRRFYGHDALLAQCTVSKGIQANQILLVRNKPFEFECWNVETGVREWAIQQNAIEPLLEQDPDPDAISCWIPYAQSFEGLTEIPVLIRTTKSTVVAAVNSAGGVRHV